MPEVVARKLATFTTAPRPKRIPFGLSSHTCPLAVRWPKIDDGWLPVTRFKAVDEAFGCWNLTVSALPIENEFQFSTALLVLCWISVVWALGVLTVTWPDPTDKPAGAADAGGMSVPPTT